MEARVLLASPHPFCSVSLSSAQGASPSLGVEDSLGRQKITADQIHNEHTSAGVHWALQEATCAWKVICLTPAISIFLGWKNQ